MGRRRARPDEFPTYGEIWSWGDYAGGAQLLMAICMDGPVLIALELDHLEISAGRGKGASWYWLANNGTTLDEWFLHE